MGFDHAQHFDQDSKALVEEYFRRRAAPTSPPTSPPPGNVSRPRGPPAARRAGRRSTGPRVRAVSPPPEDWVTLSDRTLVQWEDINPDRDAMATG